MRYAITSDGLLIAGSEAGTVAVDQASIIEKGRLGPGQMVVVDTARKVVLRNPDIKAEVAGLEPWQEWIAENRVALSSESDLYSETVIDDLVTIQRSFGYSGEDGRLIVNPMAGEGKEPTWSMGDDAPLAVLSERIRPLTAYFRQRFAQVTNPPIDSLREKKVMALDSYIGPRGNLLASDPASAQMIHLPGVVISEAQVNELASIDSGALKGVKLSTLFPVPGEGAPEGAALTAALDQLIEAAADAVAGGASVVVLSDRGIDRDHVAIPMLLAVGAVHHEMIRRGLRMKFDIVCETGEVWDVHQLACLVGYSAAAVHPWLALRAASALVRHARLRGNARDGAPEQLRQDARIRHAQGRFQDGDLDRRRAIGERRSSRSIGVSPCGGRCLLHRHAVAARTVSVWPRSSTIWSLAIARHSSTRKPSCPIPDSFASARTARRMPTTRRWSRRCRQPRFPARPAITTRIARL